MVDTICASEVRGPDSDSTRALLARRRAARPAIALLALSVAAFCYVTAEGLPVGLLTPMAHELAVTPAEVGLLLTIYGGVVVVASVPLARITARVPRRIVMLVVVAALVITPIAAALAPDYAMLTAARIAMALSQSLFWAAVVPVAAGLLAPARQGRAIAIVFAGSSLAGVLGLPIGTWIGQQVGWRIATGAVAALAVAALAALWLWMPATAGNTVAATPGPEANVARYVSLILVTVLAIGGLYVSFTFFAVYVSGVPSLGPAMVAPLLLARGIAGLVGVPIGGVLADRAPRVSVLVPVATQALSLAALWMFGASAAVAVIASMVSGLSFSVLTTALGSAVLRVSPRNVDLGAAGLSAGVNVGIAGGSLLGSILISRTAGSTAVSATLGVGAALAAAAIICAVAELASRRRRRIHRPAPVA